MNTRLLRTLSKKGFPMIVALIVFLSVASVFLLFYVIDVRWLGKGWVQSVTIASLIFYSVLSFLFWIFILLHVWQVLDKRWGLSSKQKLRVPDEFRDRYYANDSGASGINFYNHMVVWIDNKGSMWVGLVTRELLEELLPLRLSYRKLYVPFWGQGMAHNAKPVTIGNHIMSVYPMWLDHHMMHPDWPRWKEIHAFYTSDDEPFEAVIEWYKSENTAFAQSRDTAELSDFPPAA